MYPFHARSLPLGTERDRRTLPKLTSGAGMKTRLVACDSDGKELYYLSRRAR